MNPGQRHPLRRACTTLVLLGLAAPALEGGAWAAFNRDRSASDFPQSPPSPDHHWRLRLTLPRAGVGHLASDPDGPGPAGGGMKPTFQIDLSGEWPGDRSRVHWMAEVEFGIVDVSTVVESESQSFLRFGAGPALTLVDTRKSTARGTTLALQGQLGVVARSSAGNADGNIYGDGRIGPSAQLALEGVFWSSDSVGWCARLRASAELLFHEWAPTIPGASRYAGTGASLVVDVGVAF